MGTLKKIDFKGDKRSFMSISKEYGIRYGTLQNRYSKGLRDDELVSDTNEGYKKRRQVIDFKGERIELLDLAKRYNFKLETLRYRYNKGLRDDELVSTLDLQRAINVTYYSNGNPFRLTEEQSRVRSQKRISVNELQARLNTGMSVKEALSFGYKYHTKFGSLCYMFEGENSYYYIPIEDIKVLKDKGISATYITRNLMLVDDISELLLEDTKVYEEEMEYDQSYENEIKEEHRQQKIQEYKDAKYREQKPHLFDGTPQTHNWGSYAEYLASSYTFACSNVKEDK